MSAPDQAAGRSIAAEHPEQLAAGQPAGLGGARGGGVRRVEHVDVDRDVDRVVADPFPDLVDHPVDPDPLDVAAVHDGEAELGVVEEVLPVVERPADADVGRAGP